MKIIMEKPHGFDGHFTTSFKADCGKYILHYCWSIGGSFCARNSHPRFLLQPVGVMNFHILSLLFWCRAKYVSPSKYDRHDKQIGRAHV